MRKSLLFAAIAAIVLSCNNEKEKTAAATATTTTDKPSVALPYTAAYTGNWTTDVPDAELQMVLTSYKDWSDNNMAALGAAMADTTEIDMSSGMHKKLTRDELVKMWSSYRDSLSSVSIKMDAWNKMYAPDKKESYIVTWYDEIDTYKDGRVDSASYHDINQVKDGKIVWYSQYKRPKK